ncbi:hypothetical protein BDB01DRAFT_854955 [Pilobolus umbonatus]|nr:hypothetical protein BDB01DRAFT_854955 [Pilobolus umbonatus]
MNLAFTYPLKGVYFFFTNPKKLWLKTLAPIILTIVFSVFSIGFSIRVLLPHQLDWLIEYNWPHWMAWFTTVVSVILESAILNLVFFAILVPIFQDAVFDATIKARNMNEIFDNRVEVPRLVLCWRNFRSSAMIRILLVLLRILLVILTSPLQLVPVVGTALACYICGWPTGWAQHLYYDMEYRGMRVSESFKQAREKKWRYINFGSVAFALELLPVLNIFFAWTNIVGAALWIVDDYEHKRSIGQSTSRDIYTAMPAPKVSGDDNERTPLLGRSDSRSSEEA